MKYFYTSLENNYRDDLFLSNSLKLGSMLKTHLKKLLNAPQSTMDVTNF